jgi:hypothetical protein
MNIESNSISNSDTFDDGHRPKIGICLEILNFLSRLDDICDGYAVIIVGIYLIEQLTIIIFLKWESKE